MATHEDGSVVIKAEFEVSDAEKGLAKLKKSISNTERKIESLEAGRGEVGKRAAELGRAYEVATAKLERMQSAFAGTYTDEQLAQQKETVSSLYSQLGKVESTYANYTKRIDDATEKLKEQKREAGVLVQQIESVSPASRAMANAMDDAQKSAKRFGLRLKEVVRSALVFTLITQTLAKFREWMGKVIRSNGEATASVAKLKGALLTLAQPLVSFIIPAFTTFVNILTRIVVAIASFTSALFGNTVDQSKEAAEALHDQSQALEETGGAAKKAGKSLAAFDEINKLSTSTGGGAAATAVQPDFSFDTANMEVDMNRILNILKLIGAALFALKLPGTLTDGLGTFLGMLMAIEGGIRLAQGAMDAWNNGVSWDNIKDMLLGTFLLVAGLSAVLGATAGGIALVVSGLVMLVVAIKDVLENGWDAENLFLTIAGILSAGLGISILTGSWIPMLIAGIASILLAITVLTGNGGKLIENLKQIFRGFITFIDGILSGDLDKILEGAKDMVKGAVNTVLTIVGSLINAIIKGINWLIAKINSISISVPDWVPGIGGLSWSPSLPSVKEWDIPQLAQGAVIPPNREFLAVLGDQKSGTNIETPLETMIQAFRMAMRDMNMSGGQNEAMLVVDDEILGRLVYRLYNKEVSRVGTKLSEV